MGVGVALLVGFYTRIATLLVLNIMVVATYVHLVVTDPSLFPLQPTEPIYPGRGDDPLYLCPGEGGWIGEP